MLIITTIGRTGSSLLAEWCRRMDLNIGNVSWMPDRDAGNEDTDTLEINKLIMKGKDLTKRIRYLDRDVVKDPQFVADCTIIRQWKAAREDALKIIYLKRDFQAIAQSQKRHPEMTGPSFRCFPDLMAVKEREFLRECEKLEIPVTILVFPFFLDAFQEVYHAVQGGIKIKLIKSKGMLEWASLIDKTKVHVK